MCEWFFNNCALILFDRLLNFDLLFIYGSHSSNNEMSSLVAQRTSLINSQDGTHPESLLVTKQNPVTNVQAVSSQGSTDRTIMPVQNPQAGASSALAHPVMNSQAGASSSHNEPPPSPLIPVNPSQDGIHRTNLKSPQVHEDITYSSCDIMDYFKNFFNAFVSNFG